MKLEELIALVKNSFTGIQLRKFTRNGVSTWKLNCNVFGSHGQWINAFFKYTDGELYIPALTPAGTFAKEQRADAVLPDMNQQFIAALRHEVNMARKFARLIG